MPSHQVLIVQEDPLLARFYLEQLESDGLQVDTVRSGAEAVEFLQQRRPDAVVIDPVIPDLEAAEVVREIRSRPATQHLPVVALPSNRPPISRALQQAGAQILPRAPNLPAELTNAVQSALGRIRTATARLTQPLQAPSAWMELNSAQTPVVLQNMRQSVQRAVRAPASRPPLRALQNVHGFTERLGLFSQRPLFHFSAALEALVYELNRVPEAANPSVLRTVGQAIDFCGTLCEIAGTRQLRSPSAMQTLVVDDKDGAARIILASLNLVGLKSTACQNPAAALESLRQQRFDLIFLDIGLPEMNGFELCNRIRNVATHKKTPIVFITGMGTFQNRVHSSLSGGNDFIGKPFNVPELGLKALMWLLKSEIE